MKPKVSVPEGQTLHQFVAHAIAERIERGDWDVGGSLPSESVFCKTYGVSRHTLRHALSTLEEKGLILRRQGAATRVVSRQHSRRFTQSFASPRDLFRYSSSTYRVHEMEDLIVCDEELSAALKAPAGSQWFHIGAVRREQGSDINLSYSDIYFLPKFADLVREPNHTSAVIHELIESRYGVKIARAEVNIFAAGASARIAKSLAVPRHTPCLVIVRRYFDANDEPFEVTISHHPESRFVYSMEYHSSEA